jgi:hypothetical protein
MLAIDFAKVALMALFKTLIFLVLNAYYFLTSKLHDACYPI